MIRRIALLLVLLLLMQAAVMRSSLALRELRSRIGRVEQFLTELQGKTFEISR
jgi:hypothetical protein